MSEYDVIVIGGGPDGLSAALVLVRALRRVAVIDIGAPADPRGLPALDGMSSAESEAPARAEVAGHGADLISGTVAAVTPDFPVPAGPGGGDAGFRIRLGTGTIHSARRVLVATGPRDQIPAVPGLAATVTDARIGRTSVPGLWTAGSVTGAEAAAIDLHDDLVEEDVRAALPFSVAQERRVAGIRAVTRNPVG